MIYIMYMRSTIYYNMNMFAIIHVAHIPTPNAHVTHTYTKQHVQVHNVFHGEIPLKRFAYHGRHYIMQMVIMYNSFHWFTAVHTLDIVGCRSSGVRSNRTL